MTQFIETQIGMSRLTGFRRLVALSGVTHGFVKDSTNDIYTWLITFLEAEVRGNPDAMTASCFTKRPAINVTRERRRIDAM